MDGRSAVAVVAMVVLGAGFGWAQSATVPLDPHLSAEWDVGVRDGKARIAGYINSSRGFAAHDVILQVETLDAGGQVIAKTAVYLNRPIPPFDRGYFSARVPPGAIYRVTLLSVFWRSA